MELVAAEPHLSHSTTAPRSSKRRFAWQWLIVVACLAAIAIGTIRQVIPQAEYLVAYDFQHDREAAYALRQGQNPYVEAVTWLESYVPGEPLQSYYVYAPTFGLLLVPLTFLPLQEAIDVWAACNVGFLILGVYALARAGGWRPSLVAALLLGTAASVMAAVRFEIFLGNVDIFILAALALGLWARQEKRPLLAGGLIALALIVKPMLFPIAIAFLWKREFKLVAAICVSYAVLFVTPFFWLGRHVLTDVLELWQFYSRSYLGFAENVSPRGILERLFNVNPVIQPVIVAPAAALAIWLFVAACVFVVGLALVPPKRLNQPSRSLLEIGAMVVAILLAAPLTEAGYLVLLIVPLVSSVTYLRLVPWYSKTYVAASIGTFAVWALELLPRQAEALIWRTIDPHSLVSSPYFSLEPLQFYVLVASFIVQVHVLALASGQSVSRAVVSFVRSSPALVWDWVVDAWRASPVAASRWLAPTK